RLEGLYPPEERRDIPGRRRGGGQTDEVHPDLACLVPDPVQGLQQRFGSPLSNSFEPVRAHLVRRVLAGQPESGERDQELVREPHLDVDTVGLLPPRQIANRHGRPPLSLFQISRTLPLYFEPLDRQEAVWHQKSGPAIMAKPPEIGRAS